METPQKKRPALSVVPRLKPFHQSKDLSCPAAEHCPFREVMAKEVEEPIAAAYALITRSGQLLQGLRGVRPGNIQHLARLVEDLSWELHNMHQEMLAERLAEEEHRGQIRSALI